MGCTGTKQQSKENFDTVRSKSSIGAQVSVSRIGRLRSKLSRSTTSVVTPTKQRQQQQQQKLQRSQEQQPNQQIELRNKQADVFSITTTFSGMNYVKVLN